MPLAQKLATPTRVPRNIAIYAQSHPGPGKLEVWFATAVLFFSAGAFGNFTADPASGDDAIARRIWVLIFAIFLGTLVKRRKEIFTLFIQRRTVAVLLVWANLSVLWSEDPKRTAMHGVMLILSTLFAVYYAGRFTFQQQIRMLLIALGAVAILSLFAGVFFPNVAIMSDPGLAGCWRGIITHKNGLGKLMALTVVLAAICPGSKLLRAGVIVLALVMLGLSQSGSSILVLVLMLAVIPLTRILRLRRKQFVFAALTTSAALAAGAFAITSNFYSVFYFVLDKLGKTTTLTGRGPLWFVLLAFAGRRPWVGYGYDAFWLGPDSEQMSRLWRIMTWKPHNAHNGALQVVLDLGLIGLVFFGAVVAVSLMSAIKMARITKGIEYAWPLIFLVFFLASNIAEATIFEPHDMFWVLFIAVTYAGVTRKVRPALDYRTNRVGSRLLPKRQTALVHPHG